MFRRKKKKEEKLQKIGGFVFYLSLLFLLILDCFFVLLLTPTVFSGDRVIRHWTYFCMGGIAGWACATLVSGRLRVFLHEMNHKVLSGLVGNKAKKLSIGKDEGFFEYEYTKDTAAYNAFIALAPYFFPLLTIGALVIALLGWRSQHHLAVCITGMGYGADLYLNTRSISPYQTDFRQIRGGYCAGILYVGAITLAIFFFLATWVSGGLSNLIQLGRILIEIGIAIVGLSTGMRL